MGSWYKEMESVNWRESVGEVPIAAYVKTPVLVWTQQLWTVGLIGSAEAQDRQEVLLVSAPAQK